MPKINLCGHFLAGINLNWLNSYLPYYVWRKSGLADKIEIPVLKYTNVSGFTGILHDTETTDEDIKEMAKNLGNYFSNPFKDI